MERIDSRRPGQYGRFEATEHGGGIVLYPGEEAIASGMKETPVDEEHCMLVPTHWTISPMPGINGWWLRLRYRLFGSVPAGSVQIRAATEGRPDDGRRS